MFAVPILPAVLLFYPIVFLVFKKLRKETLPTAGHLLGFFGTWTLSTVPGFLLGQGFYDVHPLVILVIPTVAAILGVAIALSLFGENEVPAAASKTEKFEEASEQGHEDLFAIAWSEIEEGKMKKGLWAKAFADASGDKEKAKAIYLKSRVKRLKYKRKS